MMRWFNGITDSKDKSLSKLLAQRVEHTHAKKMKRVKHNLVTEQQYRLVHICEFQVCILIGTAGSWDIYGQFQLY